MKTTRFETKVIEVKNLTVEEVKNEISGFYNSLPATYNKGEENQFKLSRSGSDLLKIEFTQPIVLVPGVCSIDELTVNVNEIGNKQTYVTCSDFPGIKKVHFWMQYLPNGEGTAMRLVCELDIAWYNPMGRIIQNLVEKNKDVVDKEISNVSNQLEQELNKLFAPKKEEEVEAENA